MDQKAVIEITKSLDRIAKILAGMLLSGLKDLDQTNKIVQLRGCGFSNKEIANILHTTPLTVRVTLSKHKSKKKRKAKSNK